MWLLEGSKEERGRLYPHACLRGFCVGVPYRSNTVGFFVEEDDVGDVTDFGAFVADVFFDVEDCCGVILQEGGCGCYLDSVEIEKDILGGIRIEGVEK